MLPGLEPLCSGAKLGELGVFGLEKRQLQGDLVKGLIKKRKSDFLCG